MYDADATIADRIGWAKEALRRPDGWSKPDTESDRVRKLDEALDDLIKAVEMLYLLVQKKGDE